MLDDGLEDERLFYCSMVSAKSCLGGCMQVRWSAVVVSLVLIVAMKTFAKGGGMAMLR
jgi:hypothetical protein